MPEQEDQTIETKDRHPLITLGILTAGTQLGFTLIQKMTKHPVILFGMGVTAGVYSYRNRKEILQEAQHLKDQGEKLFSKKADDN